MERLIFIVFLAFLPSVLFAQMESPDSLMQVHHVKSKKRSDGTIEYFDKEGRPSGFVIVESVQHDSIHTEFDTKGKPKSETETLMYSDDNDSVITEVSKTVYIYNNDHLTETNTSNRNALLFKTLFINGQDYLPDTILNYKILSTENDNSDSLILTMTSIQFHDENGLLIEKVDYDSRNFDQYRMRSVYNYEDGILTKLTVFNKNGKWVKDPKKAQQSHYWGEYIETKTVHQYSHRNNRLLTDSWEIMIEESKGEWKLDERIEFYPEYDEKGLEIAVTIKTYSTRIADKLELTDDKRLTYEYQYYK